MERRVHRGNPASRSAGARYGADDCNAPRDRPGDRPRADGAPSKCDTFDGERHHPAVRWVGRVWDRTIDRERLELDALVGDRSVVVRAVTRLVRQAWS